MLGFQKLPKSEAFGTLKFMKAMPNLIEIWREDGQKTSKPVRSRPCCSSLAKEIKITIRTPKLGLSSFSFQTNS